MFQAFGLALRTDEGEWTFKFFQRMVNDAAFKEAIRNTSIFLVSIVPIQFILALIMALLVTAGLRGSGFWVYIYSIPIAVSDLAAGFVWLSVFTEHGYLNTVLTGLGLLDKPFIFLAYGISWPYIAVILAEVWRATSIVFVILVAGLQSIPKEYDEAAEIFGASYLTRLWRVTLPMLRPSIQVALILRTILAIQVFSVVLALTGGGIRVLASEAYQWYNNWRNPHVAAAYAAFILFASMSVGVFYLRTLRVKEETL
ncbi:MAG: sugar ABC transporter permease [Chloroflexi bacterium]|nr:MAG: sugar ABC transporter permease [Chloroflexota bacterium]